MGLPDAYKQMQLHRGFRRDAWILFLDYGRLMGDPKARHLRFLVAIPCLWDSKALLGSYTIVQNPVESIPCLNQDFVYIYPVIQVRLKCYGGNNAPAYSTING
jgi:hypothetical protein